jgi:hypothetical protein
MTAIEREQVRIRENMERIDRQSDLYKRYVLKLTSQEDQLENLRAQLEKLKAEEQKQRASLEEYLLSLDLA